MYKDYDFLCTVSGGLKMKFIFNFICLPKNLMKHVNNYFHGIFTSIICVYQSVYPWTLQLTLILGEKFQPVFYLVVSFKRN